MSHGKTILTTLKNTLIATKKTLWPFKWYILFYWVFGSIFLGAYLNPPEKNSPLWGSEATEGNIYYLNQEIYIEGMKSACIIILLFFLLATSNIKNHPRLAKWMLLSPWILLALACIKLMIESLY
ncbi:MAG: hypothetical protein IJC11_04550 [Alphaproteobacteria bacterium]|nr:hypothetical protein [Alphaproteobacteria bacterium]